MSNPWQQVFETHRDHVEQNYIAEKYGQHRSDEGEETQALYDLRNKLKNMGKDAVVAYLKRSKMSPERKARLARELGISIAEEFVDVEQIDEIAPLVAGGLALGGALAAGAAINRAQDAAKSGVDAAKKGQQVKPGIGIGNAAYGLQRRSDGLKAAMQNNSYAWKQKNKETAKEEFEALQEEAKILVRVTKEDGSVFQKKIPASQLDDYRKRYKTVVVVGGSEQSKMGVTSKNEEYVSEAKKKKPARWWDDDGDGKGYEPGEVSGKFKKKKVKEEYSDWRSELPEIAEATKAQKSVEGKAHASYENQEGDKKKRKKKSAKSECGCSHEVKEAAEVLAYELGGELVEINEGLFDAAVKLATKAAPALKLGTAPAGKLAVRTGSTAITKASKATKVAKVGKKLTPLEKAEIERLQSSSIKDRPKGKIKLSTGTEVDLDTLVKPQTQPKAQPVKAPAQTKTGVLVKLDTKTGAITKPVTQTQPKPQKIAPPPPAPPKTTPPPPKRGGGIRGGLPNLCTPVPNPLTGRMQLPPWCKPKPYLKDPVADPGTLKL